MFREERVRLGGLITMMFFVASCKLTEKKAKKEIIKIVTEYPDILAKPCADLYPVKEVEKETIKIIKGDTVVTIDTLIVDCAKEENINKKVPIARNTKIVTDTIIKEKLIIKENTALLSQVRQEVKKLENQKTRLETIIAISVIAFLIFLVISFLKR